MDPEFILTPVGVTAMDCKRPKWFSCVARPESATGVAGNFAVSMTVDFEPEALEPLAGGKRSATPGYLDSDFILTPVGVTTVAAKAGTPAGVQWFWCSVTGGIAALNPRLMAVNPSGSSASHQSGSVITTVCVIKIRPGMANRLVS